MKLYACRFERMHRGHVGCWVATCVLLPGSRCYGATESAALRRMKRAVKRFGPKP